MSQEQSAKSSNNNRLGDNQPEQNRKEQAMPNLHEENENLETELEYDSFSDDIDPLEDAPKKAQSNQKQPSEEQVRITLLEEELARTKDQMIRALAEAENARKRALKERADASKYALSGFSRDLLSVADNLRRALEAVSKELQEQHPQIKNLIDGIEATERELLRSFNKNGIQKIEPLNEPFDPNFHEVMFEAPMPDKPSGTIIQIIEPGYTINGRILRPARVGVAKNNNNANNKTSSGSEPGHNIDTEV